MEESSTTSRIENENSSKEKASISSNIGTMSQISAKRSKKKKIKKEKKLEK